MSGEPNKRSRGWIGWALLAVLVLYPLSVGPAFWFAYHSRDPDVSFHAFAKAYKPIGWLRERSTTVKTMVDWYTELWVQTR
jgi:hypothetical protein